MTRNLPCCRQRQFGGSSLLSLGDHWVLLPKLPMRQLRSVDIHLKPSSVRYALVAQRWLLCACCGLDYMLDLEPLASLLRSWCLTATWRAEKARRSASHEVPATCRCFHSLAWPESRMSSDHSSQWQKASLLVSCAPMNWIPASLVLVSPSRLIAYVGGQIDR